MSPVFDESRDESDHDQDHDFDHSVPFKSNRDTASKTPSSPKSRRPSFARSGSAPKTHNGIHRRRRKKIRW